MEKPIEIIWKEGFLNEKELVVPVINDIYNQKSQLIIDKVLRKMKIEYKTLIPLGIFFFLFSWMMGNDPWSGLLSFGVCLIWFVIGKRQYESIRETNYEANCYDYLVSFRRKLVQIYKYNLRMTLISIPVLLIPLLAYTYFNQSGKTLGEVLGVATLNINRAYLFLIIPLFMVFAYFFFRFASRAVYGPINNKMKTLINDMEKLKHEADPMN